MKLQIVYRLDPRVGGGEYIESDRNMSKKSLEELLEHLPKAWSRLELAYGNRGLAGMWIEIDGIRIQESLLPNIRFKKSKCPDSRKYYRDQMSDFLDMVYSEEWPNNYYELIECD